MHYKNSRIHVYTGNSKMPNNLDYVRNGKAFKNGWNTSINFTNSKILLKKVISNYKVSVL